MCNCVRLVLSRVHKNGRLTARSYALLLCTLCAAEGLAWLLSLLYSLAARLYALLLCTLCAAEGLAWLLSLLYSTRLVNGQSTRVIPMSHSLEEVSTYGQLQDARPR